MAKNRSWIRLGALIWCLAVVDGRAQTPAPGQGPLIWNELTASQQERLMRGEQISMSLRVANSDWPRNVAYQWVGASAKEAAAVFADFEAQKDYVPTVLESKISKRLAANRLWVDYKIDVGFLGMTSTYTVENTVTRRCPRGDFPGDLRIKWDRVKASDASVIDGLVRTQTHAGGAIFYYELYTVIQAGPLSGIAKRRGFEQMRQSVSAIIDLIQKEKAEDPKRLAHQVASLDQMLSVEPQCPAEAPLDEFGL